MFVDVCVVVFFCWALVANVFFRHQVKDVIAP